MVSFRARLARQPLFRGRAPAAFLGALLGALSPGLQGAPPAADTALLDRWLARQAEVRTWSADFVQTRSLRTLAQPLTARGRVWFAAPGRFRWELGQPARTIAVRQPDAVLVIYPGLQRAERYPVAATANSPWGQMLTLLDAGFPGSRADLDSRFSLVSQTATNDTLEIVLAPRSAAARRLMPRFQIVLDRGDLTLRATSLAFGDGSSLRNDFTNGLVNPPLDESLFQPIVPPDYQQTEPLSSSRP